MTEPNEKKSDLGAVRPVWVMTGSAEFVAEPPKEEVVDEVDEVDWDDVRAHIGASVLDVVVPGDRDGHAAWVARLLGLGDSIEYTAQIADVVKARQAAAGVEANGVIGQATWPLILPELKLGAIGPEVYVLRRLLRMPMAMVFTADVDAAVRFFQAEEAMERTGVVGRNEWKALLEKEGTK